MRLRPRWNNGNATECRPIRGRGWCRPVDSKRSMRSAAAPGSMRHSRRWPSGVESTASRDATQDDDGVEDDRLRLIFTCCHPALSPEAQVGADAPRSLRTHDRRNRQRLSHCALDARAANRPREGEDSRRGHSVPSAGARRLARPGSMRCCRSIYLVFNEGYAASSGDVGDAARSFRRSDSAGPLAGRTAAGPGGDRAARADAAARIAPRGADLADRRRDLARRSGPFALESSADRRRTSHWSREALASQQFGAYTRSGRDFGRPRRAPQPPRKPTGLASSAFMTC